MSRSVNAVHLLGNVGKDSEVRFTPSGSIVANFSLATNERRKDAQGNWQDHTEWHNLVCFQKNAELARDYVRKGTKMFIEGKLQTRSWEKDGVTQYRTEILVSQMIFIGGDSDRPAAQAQAPPKRERTLAEELEATEISDSDIPF